MRRETRRLLLGTIACAVIGLVLSRATVAPAADPPQPWALLPWDEAVGRIVGLEADSEGPKSFAITPEGGVLVLDQVNRRILELDPAGKLAATIALPSATFDDVEQFEGRAVLALDRVGRRSLLVMDRKGAPLLEVALEGRGIERSGLVTALLPRPDGVWLEVKHEHSVKVLDRKLEPCERQIVLGRPIANGLSLYGELDKRGGVSLATGGRNARGPSAERYTKSVTLTGQAPLRRIVWLDADREGRVHAVLHEALFAAESPYRVQKERYWLVLLDAELRELGRSESPWVLTLYNQRVEFRVGPDGRLWQMAFTPDGVQIIDWGRRAP